MTFAEQLQLDKDVFLNTLEFATLHEVNGENIACIINLVTSDIWSDGTQSTEFDSAVTTVKAELIINAQDLTVDLFAGALIDIDSQQWEIIESINQDNILKVKLARHT
jgi:hypothetical protein